MTRGLRLITVLLSAIASAVAINAQVNNNPVPITSNPVPEPVTKRGLAVEIRDLVRLPDTRGIRPADQDVSPAGWARVSYVRDLPDGRRFANDSRGFLYLIGAGQPAAGVCERRATFPHAVYNRLESGFIGFVFHPEFAEERPVLHGARRAWPGQSEDARLHPARLHAEGRDLSQHHHGVARDELRRPTSSQGTRRELLREAHVVANLTHPMGAVDFNPTAKPGDADYGLLYTSGSDHGFSNGGGPNANTASQTQRLDSIDDRDPAFRPAQPEGDRRREGPRRLHDSDRPTGSPPTAIRKRSARSTPTASGTPTGSHGTPTGRCSRPTSG